MTTAYVLRIESGGSFYEKITCVIIYDFTCHLPLLVYRM